jgi:hypothetical protein
MFRVAKAGGMYVLLRPLGHLEPGTRRGDQVFVPEKRLRRGPRRQFAVTILIITPYSKRDDDERQKKRDNDVLQRQLCGNRFWERSHSGDTDSGGGNGNGDKKGATKRWIYKSVCCGVMTEAVTGAPINEGG